MPIEINTIYDKKRILAFNDYIAKSRIALWIYMGICTLIVLAGSIYIALFGHMTGAIYAAIAAIVVIDALTAFVYIVFPRITLEKNRNVGTVIKYTFRDDCFMINAESTNVQESSTIKYPLIKKIRQSGGDIYLFVSKLQAFIVDTSALDEAQREQLRELLGGCVDAKKIKW